MRVREDRRGTIFMHACKPPGREGVRVEAGDHMG